MKINNTEVITTSGRKMYTYCSNAETARKTWMDQWLYLGENYYKEKIVEVNYIGERRKD